MLENNPVDRIAESLVLHLLEFLNALVPTGEVHTFAGFAVNNFLASALLLGCAAVAAAVIAYGFRQRSAMTVKVLGTSATALHSTAIITKPLYWAIAIIASYLALMPFLVVLPQNPAVQTARTLFGTLFTLGALGTGLWFGLRVVHTMERRLSVWASATGGRFYDAVVPFFGTSARIVLSVCALNIALEIISDDRNADATTKVSAVVLVLAIAAIFVRAVQTGEQMILTRYDISAADNLQARKIYTQLHVIARVIYVAIGLVSLASILMMFDRMRHFGSSLLASAGIAGIIVGFAAQKTLANLFAGFQIAMAQPIREDDVVIVEGEWGRIEEITLSYVVVHIWDDRRLIVPLSYFIEKPFQNWTRTSAAILGTVMVYVDYSCDVDTVRSELKKIVEAHSLWDGRFWNLQVTDAKERTLELRVLATSADASKSFDLRCAIREQLVAFIQKRFPQWLPRERATISKLDALEASP